MMMAEDFNGISLISRLRDTARNLVDTHFQHGFDWRIEIDGAPKDFELYAKDFTYCPIEVMTETMNVGIQQLTWPNSAGPVGVSMTMRDHEDRRIYNWFARLVAGEEIRDAAGNITGNRGMFNKDGTVNLPAEYVFDVRRYSRGKEEPTDVWRMYPTKIGDITESVDQQGFLEFPITFMQFRSWGE